MNKMKDFLFLYNKTKKRFMLGVANIVGNIFQQIVELQSV